MDFIENFDYTRGMLILSWGRPLHSLSYKHLSPRGFRGVVIGIPIFELEETPSTVFVYLADDIRNRRLTTEYNLTLAYFEVQIVDPD